MAASVKKDTGLMEGYSTEKADEFVKRALKAEKGQKQLLKRLYQDREDIVDDCSGEVALMTFTSRALLSVPEGRKLAANFIVQKLSLEAVWRTIKKFVVVGDPDRQLCSCIGNTVLHAWKFAEANPLNVEGNGKEAIETQLIQDMLFLSIMTATKKYAQKFTWMIDGLMGEEPPNKKQRHMYFRCLQPILWRNLDVPNEDVRVAASLLLLKFYPLTAEDETEDADYLQKQHEAMDKMLVDNCITIRIEAIKNIPSHVAANWDRVPRGMIKRYLSTIVDRLSFDSVVDVRAAVYEGIQGMFGYGCALNATQKTLEVIAKRGINDKTEKVRFAACEMLNALKGHRFIKLFDVVKMDDLLLRLDFEHSKSVQVQIVRLLARSFCPRLIEGIDYIDRFKRISHMCAISRNASLHFHRLIFPMKLVSVEQAVRHIRSLMLGTKSALKKLRDADAEMEELASHVSDIQYQQDLVDAAGAFKEQEAEAATAAADITAEPDNEKQLALVKNILDSVVVLWMAIRNDLYEGANAVYNEELIKGMVNILRTLESFPNTALTETALVIASQLPKDKVGRIQASVLSKLQTGNVNDPYFGHYLEAYAQWDMDRLLSIVADGLKKLRSATAVVCGVPDTPSRTPAPNSPPTKRTRTQTPSRATPTRSKPMGTRSAARVTKSARDEEGDLRRPLEFIKLFLASPKIIAMLTSQFRVYLIGFCKTLKAIRTAFGELLRSGRYGELRNHAVGGRTIVSAYETLTVLSLITAPEPDASMDDEEDDAFRKSDYLLLDEINWFAHIIEAKLPGAPVIEIFLRCACLHLVSGEISPNVLERMGTLLRRIADGYEANTMPASLEEMMRKSARSLAEALNYCKDEERADAVLKGEVVHPLIEELTLGEREGTEEEEKGDSDGGVEGD